MTSVNQYLTEALIKNFLNDAIAEPDPWDYSTSLLISGFDAGGTNGVEASAEEVAAKLGADLKSGELFHIGSEISLDVNAGIPLNTAKNWAALRAFERRGFNITTSLPTPGTRTSAKSVPHEVDVNIPASPEALMDTPIESWANHDVGVAAKEAFLLGTTNPISIALTAKIDAWYGLSSNRSMGIKSASVDSQTKTNAPTPTAPKRAPSSVPPVTRTNLLTGLRTVTVRPGDTVSQLAQSLGTSVQGIMNLNPQITNPDKINVGASFAVPAPTAPRPQIAAPLPPRKPSPPSLLTNNHNLSVLNIPDKTAPITISGVPLGATITAGVGNQIPTKKHRNKGFETGLIGLGMSPENAKNAIAATQPELDTTSPQHFECEPRADEWYFIGQAPFAKSQAKSSYNTHTR